MKFLLPLFGGLALAATPLRAQAFPIHTNLVITAPATPPSGTAVKLSQPLGRKGPTSIRFFENPFPGGRQIRPSPNPADPVGSHYLTKDRDLGQTFTVPGDATAYRLDAITVRVGVAALGGDIAGAYSAPAFLQIFEVSGTAVIHDNNTTGTTTVSVSYPNQPMADDYITGEAFTTRLVAKGDLLPDTIAIDSRGNTSTPTTSSTSTLLRFDITASGGVILHPGKRYAFMIGFETQAASRALPLDNWDYLNQSTATQSQKATGPYTGGHAIRREGRVEHPYANLLDALEYVGGTTVDPKNDDLSSFWPNLVQRLNLQPGTWGRPDVDTYRDLTFWIEGTDVDTYTAWADTQGIGTSGLYDDFNGDGSENALSYFFGTDPKQSVQAFHPLLSDANGMFLQHTRNPNCGTLQHRYEWSRGLQTWWPSDWESEGVRVTVNPALASDPGFLTTVPPGMEGIRAAVSIVPSVGQPEPASVFFRTAVFDNLLPTVGSDAWVQGTTRTLTAGSERLLVLAVAHEGNGTVTSVTYGGKTMSPIGSRDISDVNNRNYTAAFYLKEADLSTASGTTFVPIWSGAANGAKFASILLTGVNQTTPIADTDSAGVAGYSGGAFATPTLTTQPGDLALFSAVHSTTTSIFTANNGFTAGLAFAPTGCSALVGHKPADAATETPSVTNDAAAATARLALLGWVVQTP